MRCVEVVAAGAKIEVLDICHRNQQVVQLRRSLLGGPQCPFPVLSNYLKLARLDLVASLEDVTVNGAEKVGHWGGGMVYHWRED